MCLDVPSSFSCLTQTDWEVKWEVKVPLKDVFAEEQREQQSAPRQQETLSKAGPGCRSSFEGVSPRICPSLPLKKEAAGSPVTSDLSCLSRSQLESRNNFVVLHPLRGLAK